MIYLFFLLRLCNTISLDSPPASLAVHQSSSWLIFLTFLVSKYWSVSWLSSTTSFYIYWLPIGNVKYSHGFKCLLYADHSQTYHIPSILRHTFPHFIVFKISLCFTVNAVLSFLSSRQASWSSCSCLHMWELGSYLFILSTNQLFISLKIKKCHI